MRDVSGGSAVHVVVPAGIDDPARPSGGNVYDRCLVDALRELGRTVHEHPLAGTWPTPRAADQSALADLLADLPDGAVVLVDGLIASASLPSGGFPPPSGHFDRLRVVVLLHMPFAEATPDAALEESERRALGAAAAVVTTSRWSRDWVVTHHGVPADRVHVAEPGVRPADLAPGSPSGRNLLCLAAVTPDKGHDVLLAALARIADLDWHCTCVGALDLDPGFVERLQYDARRAGLAERLTFAGPLTGPRLHAALDATDLLVSASRRESYGMAVTEALARGIPVVVTDVGGHPEALGRAPGAERPGLLLPPDDPANLAAALRRWLVDDRLRTDLRRHAADRRRTLGSWEATAVRVGEVLDTVRVNRPRSASVSPITTTG